MPEHKHLLIRAEVNKPIKEEKILKKWLKDLVKKIDMKIISKFAYLQKLPPCCLEKTFKLAIMIFFLCQIVLN